jgi:ribonuclease P protein component
MAGAVPFERLRKRAEFRAAAGGKRVSREGFVIQAVAPGREGPARFGLTITKKIGNAVVRNRIRRRLREVVRQAGSGARDGTDYVLVGRRAALTLEFDRLIADLKGGLAALANAGGAKKPERDPRS